MNIYSNCFQNVRDNKTLMILMIYLTERECVWFSIKRLAIFRFYVHCVLHTRWLKMRLNYLLSLRIWIIMKKRMCSCSMTTDNEKHSFVYDCHCFLSVNFYLIDFVLFFFAIPSRRTFDFVQGFLNFRLNAMKHKILRMLFLWIAFPSTAYW